MKPLVLLTMAAVLILAPATGFAHQRRTHGHGAGTALDLNGDPSYLDRHGQRHRIDDSTPYRDVYRDVRDPHRESRGSGSGARGPRTIYVIEADRPVPLVVDRDSSGRYYRWEGGRRVYIVERHYDTYPSKYYFPDGSRRVTITGSS